jgi:hypothetical protein
MVEQFANTDRLIKRAEDIVIGDCVSIPTNKPVFVDGHWVTYELGDGLRKVEVNIVRVLKGNRPIGKQIIATIHPMTPGKEYLLSNSGGSVGATGDIATTDFLAVPELSVVEIPSHFDLTTLDGKELKEQMQSIFSRHLFEVERKLVPLLNEQGLLEKAVADRQYEWFDSGGPVKLGQIVETSTTNEHSLVWLNLEDKKLEWSGGMPGKQGYLYFEKMGPDRWKPYWEFSSCDATNIESLAGIPLRAKFSGLFSPGTSGQSIQVSVGQVLFARTVDEPNTVFVIQIVGQDKDHERMSVRYAIVQR